MTGNAADRVLGGPWLLLIHQLPPEPAYLRVKVRRRLHRLGALPLKNTVYVLPATVQNVEDLQWLANEIISDGGEATICAATFLSGTSHDDLAIAFGMATSHSPAIAKDPIIPPVRPRHAVWVTRADVYVDRMASAWLIQRFIDRQARFRFVKDGHYRRRPGEIRFDMYGGEFTHVGERCTFEVLLEHFGLRDDALRTIGEIVHDIDLKDDKYRRSERSGIESVLRGIAGDVERDQARIERARLVLDSLYARLSAADPRGRRPRATRS